MPIQAHQTLSSMERAKNDFVSQSNVYLNEIKRLPRTRQAANSKAVLRQFIDLSKILSDTLDEASRNSPRVDLKSFNGLMNQCFEALHACGHAYLTQVQAVQLEPSKKKPVQDHLNEAAFTAFTVGQLTLVLQDYTQATRHTHARASLTLSTIKRVGDIYSSPRNALIKKHQHLLEKVTQTLVDVCSRHIAEEYVDELKRERPPTPNKKESAMALNKKRPAEDPEGDRQWLANKKVHFSEVSQARAIPNRSMTHDQHQLPPEELREETVLTQKLDISPDSVQLATSAASEPLNAAASSSVPNPLADAQGWTGLQYSVNHKDESQGDPLTESAEDPTLARARALLLRDTDSEDIDALFPTEHLLEGEETSPSVN